MNEINTCIMSTYFCHRFSGEQPPAPGFPASASPALMRQTSTPDDTDSNGPGGETMSCNKKTMLKWEKDEPLGELSTISPVLYANAKHPQLKQQHPGK